MNDRDWDNYIRKVEGTLYGDFARQYTHNETTRPYYPPTHTGTGSSGPIEDTFAGWFFIGVWVLVIYYGMKYTTLEWYWPFGAGFVAGVIVFKLLSGPLRFLMTWLSYLLAATALGILAYLVIGIIQNT